MIDSACTLTKNLKKPISAECAQALLRQVGRHCGIGVDLLADDRRHAAPARTEKLLPFGGARGCGEKAQLMSASEIDRTLVRLAHEILEKNSALDRLAFIGIRRRGVPLAQRLARKIEALEKRAIPVGILDINLYRDDLTTVDIKPVVSATDIPFSVQGRRHHPDGRRALHRPHHPRRARCAVRPRPAGARATAGADRPRPPRTADRSPLRRAQGADHRRRNHRSEIPGDRRDGKGPAGRNAAAEAV